MSEKVVEKIPESIDPRVLIEQKGPDAGRIHDIELARIGAVATDESLKTGSRYNPEYTGVLAMADEVARRALQEFPNVGYGEKEYAYKEYLESAASSAFIDHQEQKEQSRKKARVEKVIGELGKFNKRL